MKALKITIRVSAVLAVVFILLSILVAAGVVGSSSGFLDLTNIVAIAILGLALLFSIIASVTSLIYKLKIKSMVSDASTIAVINVNAKRKERNK